MYRSYYKLRRKPFDLTPDPKMVYMSEEHQEALSILRYGVLDKKDFLLLSGEVGTGKSTLLQVLLESIDPKHHTCLLANPLISLDDLYLYMADSFKLPPFTGSRAKFLIAFGKFLQKCGKRGERVLLIVDEAHALSLDTLEEIRMLSNQPASPGVFGIFLVGQPEINDLLSSDQLLPLRQRISLRFHLTPFDRQETDYYIRQRLLKAGGKNLDIFSEDAVDAIFAASGGTPRAINVICDHALITGYGQNQQIISSALIAEALQDVLLPPRKNLAQIENRYSTEKNKLQRLVYLLVFLLGATGLYIFFTTYL